MNSIVVLSAKYRIEYGYTITNLKQFSVINLMMLVNSPEGPSSNYGVMFIWLHNVNIRIW